MKYLLLLAIGFGLGIYVDRYQLHLPELAGPASVQGGMPDRDDLSQKLIQWHLTADDIRQDLARTGEVVRIQAQGVGGKISDVRIAAVVKAKLILDRELSNCEVRVSVRDGHVTLEGSVGTPELLGRAMALALETDGVMDVGSKIEVTKP